MIPIGQKIARVREARGWSQEVVAKQIGISATSYAKIERNEVDLTVSRLTKIAEVLEVDVVTFFYAGAPIVIIGDNSSQAQTNSLSQVSNHYIGNFEAEREAYKAHLETLQAELARKDAMIEKILAKI